MTTNDTRTQLKRIRERANLRKTCAESVSNGKCRLCTDEAGADIATLAVKLEAVLESFDDDYIDMPRAERESMRNQMITGYRAAIDEAGA